MNSQKEEKCVRKITFGGFLRFVIQIAIMGLAAYLSWQCNTKLGKSDSMKFVMAFFAAMFGPVYIVMYIIFSMELCNRLPVVPAIKVKN